jgi:hypothetical protein
MRNIKIEEGSYASTTIVYETRKYKLNHNLAGVW